MIGKLKLKLDYTAAKVLCSRMEDLIGDYEAQRDITERIFAPMAGNDEAVQKRISELTSMLFGYLWLGIYLELEGKSKFQYFGEKSYSFNTAEAVAYQLILMRWSATELDNYRFALFQSQITLLDPKLI